jgi:hypothetical protein
LKKVNRFVINLGKKMKRNDDERTGREGVNYKDDNVDDAGEGVGQADGNDKKEIGNDDRIDDNVNGVG